MSGLFTRNRLIGLALAALVAIIDQVVKWYVIGPLQLRQVLHIDLLRETPEALKPRRIEIGRGAATPAQVVDAKPVETSVI